ncbi:MAG: hypothetical protein JWL73_1923, partial [Actinomycetia bacterium]|nr:hypothetical protein [Actinomycetes bacterium]
MERWQSGGSNTDGARRAPGEASVTALPGVAREAGHPAGSAMEEPVDTMLLDLLPHPAFAIAVDGDDVFRFIYANDAYRALRDDETPVGTGPATGDLRAVVPANALVAHVRAFARAARERRTIAFETEWGTSIPARRVAVDVTPLVGPDGTCDQL